MLAPESRQILAEIEVGLDHDERYGGRAPAVRRTAYATYALIAVNLLVFVAELLLGGSTNVATLTRMGALVPSAVARGEWWRVVAALFLHYGWLHVAVNALGLLILGPFVEFAIGRARYLLAYFLAGLGSMVAIVLVALGTADADSVLVGASGGIMGLVGATVAVHLRGWLRERARVSSRRLVLLVLIIACQIVFDLATPESSFLAHFGGVLIGLLVASLMPRRRSPAARTRLSDHPSDGS